jgi:DNA-binding transcriptional ArsR family regulator
MEWALNAAERPEFRRDHPELAALYEAHPELGHRARSFWDGDTAFPEGGFVELIVLAQLDGRLLSLDADALIARLEHLCATSPADLTFPSEPEEDQDTLRRRLTVLRHSAELRQRYVELMGDLWEAARPVWDRYGYAATDAAGAARRARLAEGASWVEVSEYAGDCWSVVPGLVADLGEGDELVVVPAFFTHLGLVFSMPGIVIVGVRTDPSGAQARARTELVARRLKTMADPTRLAIIGTLAGAAHTVTEIARLFDLSQPTVSNHVKVLRDAGLVAKVRHGNRQDLEVQRDAVNELLGHLQSVLAPT